MGYTTALQPNPQPQKKINSRDYKIGGVAISIHFSTQKKCSRFGSGFAVFRIRL